MQHRWCLQSTVRSSSMTVQGCDLGLRSEIPTYRSRSGRGTRPRRPARFAASPRLAANLGTKSATRAMRAIKKESRARVGTSSLTDDTSGQRVAAIHACCHPFVWPGHVVHPFQGVLAVSQLALLFAQRVVTPGSSASSSQTSSRLGLKRVTPEVACPAPHTGGPSSW
jgi:hypothetical protein